MQEYIVEVKRTLLQMVAWGAVICGIAYFTGLGWRIPGLILGLVTSLMYFILMCYRIGKSAEMTVPKAISYMRLGWLLRLSFVALMLVLSIKIPLFDFLSAVIGLFSLQAVMIGNAGVIIVKGFFRPSK